MYPSDVGWGVCGVCGRGERERDREGDGEGEGEGEDAEFGLSPATEVLQIIKI